MLRGNESQISLQLLRVLEAVHIPNLGNNGGSNDKRYDSQGLICFNQRYPAPLFNMRLYLLGDPFDPFATFICRVDILLKGNLMSGMRKLDCCQPVIKALGPVLLPGIMIPMTQKKC